MAQPTGRVAQNYQLGLLKVLTKSLSQTTNHVNAEVQVELIGSTTWQTVSALEFTPLTGNQSGGVKVAPTKAAKLKVVKSISLYVY